MQRKKRQLNDVYLIKPQKAEKERQKQREKKKNKDNKQEIVINMVNNF